MYVVFCLFVLRETDEESGPIVRVAQRRRYDSSDSDEDSVVNVDCRPFWRRLGFSRPFIDNLWIVKDCCGLTCAVFTWLLIGYAEFVVLFVILLPSENEIHSIINGTVFHFFTALAFLSHLRAMMTDPVSC